MSTNFDPYHRWLGIRPEEQPADHYRLLGLSQFEDDHEVICDAVERQISHVRRYALGEHRDVSQKILNELARAKTVLLDDARRAEYDRQLQNEAKTGQTAPGASSSEVMPPIEQGPAPVRPIAASPPPVDPPPREALADPPFDTKEASSPPGNAGALLGGAPPDDSSAMPPLKSGRALQTTSPAVAPSTNTRRSRRNSPRGILKPVNSLDRFLKKLAGQGNTRLHHILRTAVVAIFFALISVPIGIAVWREKSQRDLARVETETRRIRETVGEAHRDAKTAQQDARALFKTHARSSTYARGEQRLADALAAVQQDRLNSAQTLFLQAADLFEQAKPEILALNDLARARDAWSAARADAESEWLDQHAQELFQQACKQVDSAVIATMAGKNGEAATLYRNAVETLATADVETPTEELRELQDAWSTALGSAERNLLEDLAKKPFDASLAMAAAGEAEARDGKTEPAIARYREAVSDLEKATTEAINLLREQCVAVIDRKDRPMAEGILTKLEAFSPQNQQLVDIRHRIRNLPQMATAPFPPDEARQHQQAWADNLRLPVEVNNSVGMRFVLIPPGEYLMGSAEGERDRNDDERQHPVRITKPFYLGLHEATYDEYRQVTKNMPMSYWRGRRRWEGSDPVERVTWQEAVNFCEELSSLKEERAAHRAYRLPTEAEWEYACRAGSTTPFHFGNHLSGGEANCDGTHPYGTGLKGVFLQQPTKVGAYRPNVFGLCDMHGNVWEWCQDWYVGDYYNDSPQSDPKGGNATEFRVTRGGSWKDAAGACRSAYRFGFSPIFARDALGFRVAMTPPGV